jgi:hypothetical protein
VICDVWLIPAMEVSSCVQGESPHWWLCLELSVVHVVLHRHLQDSVASSFCLHLHCAPRLRNLHSTHNIIHWSNRQQAEEQGKAITVPLEVNTVVTMQSTVVSVVMPCDPIQVHWHFSGTYGLHL